MRKKETEGRREEADIPLYVLYRYVPPQRVWFFSWDPGLKDDNQGVCQTNRQANKKEDGKWKSR